LDLIDVADLLGGVHFSLRRPQCGSLAFGLNSSR
jgi:hypothetical protein